MDNQIEEIREREQAATKGEWYRSGEREVHSLPGFYPILIAKTAQGVRGDADAEFIAHAREDIPFLLDEIFRLTARVEALKEDCNQWKETANGQQGLACEALAELAGYREAVAEDIRQSCGTCKHRKKKSCPWTNETVASTGQKVDVCNAWQWRGTVTALLRDNTELD